jgi:hypothetical protein
MLRCALLFVTFALAACDGPTVALDIHFPSN